MQIKLRCFWNVLGGKIPSYVERFVVLLRIISSAAFMFSFFILIKIWLWLAKAHPPFCFQGSELKCLQLGVGTKAQQWLKKDPELLSSPRIKLPLYGKQRWLSKIGCVSFGALVLCTFAFRHTASIYCNTLINQSHSQCYPWHPCFYCSDNNKCLLLIKVIISALIECLLKQWAFQALSLAEQDK